MAIDLPEHDLPRGDEAEEHGERSGFRAEGRLGLCTAAELAELSARTLWTLRASCRHAVGPADASRIVGPISNSPPSG